MSHLDIAYSPISIRGLTLKNRFIKTATYEGMTPNGIPSDSLIDLHTRIAEGGTALTTVAYGAVSQDGRTHEDQLIIDKSSAKPLEKLVSGVHKAGGKASVQLTHCGFFSSNNSFRGAPVAPSRILNLYGLLSGKAYSVQMDDHDLDRVRKSFVDASSLVRDIGFDTIEVHMGHGYLLSQFLSPVYNKRDDRYGGELESRVRYPLEVMEDLRNSLGDTYPIMVKTNLDDGIPGGTSPKDCIYLVNELDRRGLADNVILSGGTTSQTPFFLLRGNVPRLEMASVQKGLARKIGMLTFGRKIMKSYPFKENYFMGQASDVRTKTSIKLTYLGGVSSTRGISEVFKNNFDMVAIGRSLIHDPEFIEKLRNQDFTSPCNHCNKCLVEMDKGGVRCVLNN